MSKLVFTFSVPTPAKRSRNTHPEKAKLITGVITIDENANYHILSKDENGNHILYNISPKSYSCKDRDIIYKFNEHKKGIMQLFRNSCYLPKCSWQWKPFAPGVIIKGYLKKTKNFEECVEILKIDYIESNNDADDAKKFYYANWKKIHKNYELKYGRENS